MHTKVLWFLVGAMTVAAAVRVTNGKDRGAMMRRVRRMQEAAEKQQRQDEEMELRMLGIGA